MCAMFDEKPEPIETMLSILPNPKDHEREFEHGGIWYEGLEDAVERVMPQIRELTGNCPACIMAALRQKGIPVPVARSFDFTSESKKWWSDFNESQMSKDRMSYLCGMSHMG